MTNRKKHLRRIIDYSGPVFLGKFRQNMGKIWRNSSNQKIAGLMIYAYLTVIGNRHNRQCPKISVHTGCIVEKSAT